MNKDGGNEGKKWKHFDTWSFYSETDYHPDIRNVDAK